jgi:hypothetical protein
LSSLNPRLMKQNIQKHPEKEVGVSFTSLPDLYSTGLGPGEIALDSSATSEKAKEGNAAPFCSDAGSHYGGQCGKLERDSSFEAWLSPDFRVEESYQATQGSSSLPEKSTGVQTEDADVVILIPQLPPMQWLSVKVHTGHSAPRRSLRKYRHNPSGFAGLTDPVAEAETSSTSNLRQEPRRQNRGGDTDDHNYIARQAMCRSNESVFISAVQELAETSDCWE